MPSLQFNTYEVEADNGYGVVSKALVEHLAKDDRIDLWQGSKNILNFCKPQDYKFGDYTIGYTPWESTEIPDEWFENLKRSDEIWVPATWQKELWKQHYGLECWVLPHGIDPCWKPIRRHWEPQQQFVFLHVGEPAIRKGGDIVLRVWYKYFKDNPNVKLIYKTTGSAQCRILDDDGSIVCTPYDIDNIEVIDRKVHPAELWQIYALAHCLVYPSRGEGFGLIPLEAMATGLPTMLSARAIGDFADYAECPLYNTSWIETTVQQEHPGNWLEYDDEEIYEQMDNVRWIYEHIYREAYTRSKLLHNEYNWSTISRSAVDRIIDRIQ